MNAFIRTFVGCCLIAVPAQAQEFSRFTQNVVLHILAHEMGHAVIREFDLPVLGPEEDIADDFATVVLWMTLPDRVGEIVIDRAAQHRADGEEVGPFSEYRSDAHRAGRSICLLYGLDPVAFAEAAEAAGLDLGSEEAEACVDFAPEIARGWRRILEPLWMPEGAPVTEVRLSHDPSSPIAAALSDSETIDIAMSLLARFDWHSQITLRLAQCDGSAGWSRNGRVIGICDSYITRIEAQAP